jgi:hypothetical protein
MLEEEIQKDITLAIELEDKGQIKVNKKSIFFKANLN